MDEAAPARSGTSVAAVGGPAAWRGREIASSPEWRYQLDSHPHSGETAAVVAMACELADSIRAGDRALIDLRLPDVEVSALRRVGAAIRRQLLDGTGFALVRGLPVDDLDDIGNEVLYWAIGLHVGIPIHQDQFGSVLIRVRDQGKSFDEVGVRAYETAARLEYHTDSSDVVGLYCLRPAMQGGTSTIVSSVAVHDAIVRTRPDLAGLLHEPWPHLSAIDGSVSWKPIAALNDRGRLFSRYGRKYIEMAPEQHDDMPALSADQRAVLDLYDDLCNSDEFVLDMDFRPGDVQFLNNYVIMHSRTEYVDWPEPERRRELMRIWLVFRDELHLPPVFEESGFVPRSVAFGAPT